MKKLLKKRQLVMAALVLALGGAVFINWYYTKDTVAADAAPIASQTQEADASAEPGGTDDANLGDSQYVHNPYASQETEYFAGAKLKRAAAHDEAKETLSAVIDDENAAATAVSAAAKSLDTLSATIKTEADCESLITAKTGSECLVMIDASSVQAVVGGKALDAAMALQIKEILMNKTGMSPENITIVELAD
ncbi:MAG: SpoIIIAH-like family protein [Oscillospiraceae bacterium]|jgi:stage III sporulation protein AH|nr:SpoIIIAH-like family protein [Oscillospiraceae bacterium]